jgi:hypothetical protein
MAAKPKMNEYFVVENFVSAEDCTNLIAFIDSLPEESFTQKRDGRLTIANENLEVSTAFINKYTPKVQEKLTADHQVRTFFLSVYPPSAGILPHVDEPEEELKNDMGVVYILNSDFYGGEIYFPEWDFMYKPKTGDAVFFPINKYMHGVQKVISGVRYSVPLQYSNVPGQALPFLVYPGGANG